MSTSVPRRRLPRAEREQQMLEVARRIFAREGFHGASMDEIAAEAGISKPMLYAYFESKEGLFLAAAERAANQLVEHFVEAAGGPAEPEQRLWRGLQAFFSFVEDNREAWRVLYPEPPASPGPFAAGAAAARRRMLGIVAGVFAEAAEQEGVRGEMLSHVDALAHQLVAMAEAGAQWWLAHPDEPRDIQALRVMNLAWTGLAGLARGRLWLPS